MCALVIGVQTCALPIYFYAQNSFASSEAEVPIGVAQALAVSRLRSTRTGSEVSSMIDIFTTGGTIDKVYFDALSEFQIGPAAIPDMLRENNVHVPHRVTQLMRSEEHTSELQSLMRISYAVFCFKKKTNNTQQ